MSGDGTVFDAREAFADEERGGDLLWSDTPAQAIPFRRKAREAEPPPEVEHTFDAHGDLLEGKAARRARAAAGSVAPLRPGAAPDAGRPGRGAAPPAGGGPPGAPRSRPHAAPPPSEVAPVAPPRPNAGQRSVAPAVAAPRRGGPRRLGEPQPTRVEADGRTGRPLAVDGRAVEGVRESWLVEDRWWTDRPLRRRYWEVVTDDGRNLVVFRELGNGRWYGQRG